MKYPSIVQLMGMQDQVQVTILYDAHFINTDELKSALEEAAEKAVDEEQRVLEHVSMSENLDADSEIDFDVFARIEEIIKEKFGDSPDRIKYMTNDIIQVWTTRL